MRLAFVFLVGACVPGYHMPHGGVCPTDRGCEAATEPAPRFVPPDDEHVIPEETVEGVLAEKPATCEQVALTEASFELGDYASDEERVPTLERDLAACTREHPGDEELRCLVEASDLPGMAYCVPHMFPYVRFELYPRARCAALVGEMRERVALLRFSHRVGDVVERRLAAIETSCEQDSWPLALGECANGANWQPQGAATEPLEPCLPLVNPTLQHKITARLDATTRTAQ